MLLKLRTAEDVLTAYRAACCYGPSIIVEAQLEGRDYRVLVVGGRVVAVSEKRPANVVGDGVHTIHELVEIANRDPRRGDHHSRPMSKIACDLVVEAYLKRQGLDLLTVPGTGQTVFLRESANLSTGGEARDVTDLVHPQV